MQEYWRDGRAWLKKLPVNIFPVLMKKLEQESGIGVVIAVKLSAPPWFGRLNAVIDDKGVDPDGRSRGIRDMGGSSPVGRIMGNCGRKESLRK